MRKPDTHERMTEATTIAKAFQVYRAEVIPLGAGPDQVLDTERTFHAAAFWVVSRIQQFSAGKGKTVDVGEALVEIGLECLEYAKTIR